MSTRLERSTANRVIGGVCGGIAEYLQVDATLVRVFFVAGAFITAGLGILAYIVLLVLMPLPGQPQPFVQGAGATMPNTGATAPVTDAATGQPLAPPIAPPDPEAAERRRATFGYFLVALGVIFLLGNIGAFRFIRWDLIWPLVLVAAGVLLLMQRMRR